MAKCETDLSTLNTNLSDALKYVHIGSISTSETVWDITQYPYNKFAVVLMLTNGMRIIQEISATMIGSELDVAVPISLYVSPTYNVYINVKIFTNSYRYQLGGINGYTISKVMLYGVK